MYSVSRQLKSFSAAHRLNKGYQGKCQHLHGHNYVASVTLQVDALDAFDFVMDFDDIKQLFDTWIQQHWDHVTLVSEQDVTLLKFLKEEQQQFFLIPGGVNTTAEVLAHYLFTQFSHMIADTKIQLVQVDVWESPHAKASYSE